MGVIVTLTGIAPEARKVKVGKITYFCLDMFETSPYDFRSKGFPVPETIHYVILLTETRHKRLETMFEPYGLTLVGSRLLVHAEITIDPVFIESIQQGQIVLMPENIQSPDIKKVIRTKQLESEKSRYEYRQAKAKVMLEAAVASEDEEKNQ